MMTQVLADAPIAMLRSATMNTVIVCCAAYYFPQHRNLIQRVVKRYLATSAFEEQCNFRAEDKDGLPISIQEFYQLVFAPCADRLTSDRKNEPRTRTPEPKVV